MLSNPTHHPVVFSRTPINTSRFAYLSTMSGSRPRPLASAGRVRTNKTANHGSPLLPSQVTDYLKKKGFTKTEAVFRQETAYLGPDGRPAVRNEDPGPKKYLKAFLLLRNWIENNLDIYKVREIATHP